MRRLLSAAVLLAMMISISAFAMGLTSFRAWFALILPATTFLFGLGNLLTRQPPHIALICGLSTSLIVAVLLRFFAGIQDGSVGRSAFLLGVLAFTIGYFTVKESEVPFVMGLVVICIIAFSAPVIYFAQAGALVILFALTSTLIKTKDRRTWMVIPALSIMCFLSFSQNFDLINQNYSNLQDDKQISNTVTSATSAEKKLSLNSPLSLFVAEADLDVDTAYITLLCIAVVILVFGCLAAIIIHRRLLHKKRHQLQGGSPEERLLAAWSWLNFKIGKSSNRENMREDNELDGLREKVERVLFQPLTKTTSADADLAWKVASDIYRRCQSQKFIK